LTANLEALRICLVVNYVEDTSRKIIRTFGNIAIHLSGLEFVLVNKRNTFP